MDDRLVDYKIYGPWVNDTFDNYLTDNKIQAGIALQHRVADDICVYSVSITEEDALFIALSFPNTIVERAKSGK